MKFRLTTMTILPIMLLLAGWHLVNTVAASSSGVQVTNTNDSGAGSLRQAVLDSQDGNTITFHPSLSGGIILLQSDLPLITKTLTLDASAAPNLTVSGLGSHRSGFEINIGGSLNVIGATFANGNSTIGGGFDNRGDLRLEDVTIRNNIALNGGGGIYSRGTLVLQNVTVETNTSSNVRGGGIYNFGDATIRQSNIRNNSVTSGSGGGIYSAGVAPSLIVKNSSISENSSSGGGGGLEIEDGDASIIATEIYSNSADTGGGLRTFSSDTSVTIRDSEIRDNTSSGNGGGIYHLSSELITLTRVDIKDNIAGSAGGGIYVNGGPIVINDSTIMQNMANGLSGGGINGVTGDIEINASRIRANRANVRGGGISTSGSTLSINNSLLDENVADNSDVINGFGGAIYSSNALTITNSTISNNFAESGGAAITQSSFNITPTVKLIHTTITSNTLSFGLQSVQIIGDHLYMRNSIIANTDGAAGSEDCTLSDGATQDIHFSLVEDNSCNIFTAIDNLDGDPNLDSLALNNATLPTHALLTGSAAIDAGTLADCIDRDQRGFFRHDGACDLGAFEVSDGNCATDDGSTIRVTLAAGALQQAVNAAPIGGTVRVAGRCAGVQTQGSNSQTVFFNKTIFVEGGHTPLNWGAAPDNVLYPTMIDAENNGRAVFVTANTTAVLQHIDIVNGTSATSGGGIFMADGASLTLGTVRLYDNSAEIGGALSTSTNSTLVINDSSFFDNSADFGGALHHFGTTVTINRSTFNDNVANFVGGGLHINGAMTLNNSTVSGNSAVLDGGGVFVSVPASILNSTIVLNSANGSGGGLYAGAATTLTNSIIAYSEGDDCVDQSPVTVSFSLIEDGSCLVGQRTNLVGDPLLDLLVNNGGPTLTHALQSNLSPALNSGDSATCLGTDQRGVLRDSPCDLGSFESDFTVPSAVSSNSFAVEACCIDGSGILVWGALLGLLTWWGWFRPKIN